MAKKAQRRSTPRPKPRGELSPQQMEALLTIDRQKRVQLASAAINEILNKYNVSMSPKITLTKGNVDATIEIVPVE